MLCAHAEKLIPLFAGDDLPAREADALRLHMESCANCRRLAAEFEESREWLREFPAPQFDEAALDGMRVSVLRDIGRIENRSRRFQWIALGWQGWNLRFAIAASLALLLFGALFSLAINRRQSPRDPESNQAGLSPDKTPADGASNEKQIAVDKPVRRKFGRKLSKPRPKESPQTETGKIEPDPIIQNMGAVEPADQSISDYPAPDPNQDMLRIEIQTADPNIRIIWFAPKSDAAPRK
jgi:putative zinc finger protein